MQLARSSERLWHQILPRPVCVEAPIHNRVGQGQKLRNITQFSYDKEELGPCQKAWLGRPIFKRHRGTHNNVRGGVSDLSDMREMEKRSAKDGWWEECLPRLQTTGLYTSKYAERLEFSDDSALMPWSQQWSHPSVIRMACRLAYQREWRATSEIQARKFCAEVKDVRYPDIYHTLDAQAHILYILGRTELERNPIWRGFAWYMLSISAGLGQLDAALLLHQLEKFNVKYSLHVEQRATISKAAEMKSDWRAMVAHCEHMVSTAKGRSGRMMVPASEMNGYLELLSEALALTGPTSYSVIEKESPPEGFLDVEVLETFDPPYKLMLELTTAEMATENVSDELIKFFTLAAKDGALQYKDPKAAWSYAQWCLADGRECDVEWLECVELAAESGNPEACFELAKYHLKKDGWWPSLAVQVIRTVNLQHGVDEQDEHDREVYLSDEAVEKEKHNMILRQKNLQLLSAQAGMRWMSTAAQLELDSPVKMLNRYCIMAGLLRQNGHTDEGREILQDAETELKSCVGEAVQKNRALRILREYLEHWNSRLVHHLLTPNDLVQLLEASHRK